MSKIEKGCCKSTVSCFYSILFESFSGGDIMKKQLFYRILFYAAGLLILALGLTLNTKTGLGVSPIISVAYSIATIFDHNFRDGAAPNPSYKIFGKVR